MVEVPLEIEAELPREFDGNALLASSGLPRKVKIKPQRDTLKLSTAYRADQLLADIVRTTLRGSPQDVQRVQDAVRAYVRTVRERRQEGATLLVQSNGRGKIEVTEQMPQAPLPLQSRTPPPPRSASFAPEALQGKPSADRVALLEKRLLELESAIPRILSEGAAGAEPGKWEERLALLEAKMAGLQNTVSRAAISAEVAGPGMERRSSAAAPRDPALRRNTAVEAFAEGLRDELRVRVKEQLDASARTSAVCDRAAALAAEAEQSLGAPRNGTAQRMRTMSALAAARQQALRRVQEEVDLYQPPDLLVAAQLVSRLEEKPSEPEPTAPLQALAEQLVRSAQGTDLPLRSEWLARTSTLCNWTLIEPAGGQSYDPELHDAVSAGGEQIAALAAPGLRRHDGSVLARARVLLVPARLATVEQPPPPEEVAKEVAAPELAAPAPQPEPAPPSDHAHLLWRDEPAPPELLLLGPESEIPSEPPVAASAARPAEPAQLELAAAPAAEGPAGAEPPGAQAPTLATGAAETAPSTNPGPPLTDPAAPLSPIVERGVTPADAQSAQGATSIEEPAKQKPDQSQEEVVEYEMDPAQSDEVHEHAEAGAEGAAASKPERSDQKS